MPLIGFFDQKDQKAIDKFINEIFSEMGWKKDFLYGTKDITSSFGGEKDAFFVVKEKDRVVGTLGLKELDENEGLLKRFYLAEECRGQGVARDLLKRAIEFAREKSYQTLVLDTQADNLRAQRFYEKCGFKPFMPKPNKKWPESQHPEIFVFRKLEIKYFGLSQKSL